MQKVIHIFYIFVLYSRNVLNLLIKNQIFLFTVHCFPYAYTNFRFVKTNETNEQNNSLYLKVRDGVNIKTDTDYTLRSQDVSFEIEDKLYQEIAGHKEKVGRNDEVIYYLFNFIWY